MIAAPNTRTSPAGPFDLVIVGAGIVGLAHAYHAVRAGLRVVVLERDQFAVGASVRNFGHVGTTAQAGQALEYALDARDDWITVGHDAGIPVAESGAIVIARTDSEMAVLEAFAAARDGAAQLLSATEATNRLGFAPPSVAGGANLRLDLRVDPLTAVASLAAYLVREGVEIRFRVTVNGVADGVVHTTRGDVLGTRILLAVNYDVDRFFPDVADAIGLTRCRLRMLEVDAPDGLRVAPAVLTGLSLLRYDGFATLPAAQAVRDEIATSKPELLEQSVNLMFTQRPNGRIVLGDTHHYDVTETPFEDEASDELLLDEFRRLFGAERLVVRRRWRGIYASSPTTQFLIDEPLPGVIVVSVTTGIGMTTAFGLARSVLARVLERPRVAPHRTPAPAAALS